MKYEYVAILLGVVFIGGGCKTETRAPVESSAPPPVNTYPAMGKLERLDPQFDALIPSTATIERLAEGYDWSEGPVWMRVGGFLLFSDVPKNTVYSWKEGLGAQEFLKPSGYTGSRARGGEPGSNGLTVDSQGRLVLCQHGDRRVSRLDLDRQFKVLAEFFEGRRFNSPNDVAFKSNGDFYFTDPPYGLEKLNDDPDKEMAFNGVYRVRPDGNITLLIKGLTFPNGIAFSPDERILYVAISDPNRPVIMAYDVQADGTLDNERVFFDAKPLMPGRKGLPDGLKVDLAGNLFATGPGGVLVISPAGVHLGTINTGEATANCAWGDDGSVLYITADMYLCRIRTTTKGRIP
jgi:gluconolactonase